MAPASPLLALLVRLAPGLLLMQAGSAQSFGPQQVLSSNGAFGAESAYATDLDGDGDADVLSTSLGDDRIVWFENLGGGSFGTSQAITASAEDPRSVYATDLDGDGDADVLSASFSDDKIAWYENHGGGSFGPGQVITTSAFFALSLHAEDLDGDGDADLLSASAVDDKIAWYELLGFPDCNGNGSPDARDIVLGTSSDCDGNGVPDECDLASSPARDLDANGVLDECERVGTSYFCPATSNSTGETARLTALGSDASSLNDLTLLGTGLPAASFCMFFTSQTQGYSFSVPGSQGLLCVGGAVGRFNRTGEIRPSGPTGVLVFPLNLQDVPTPMGSAQALPGETWNFQAWYRDANPTVTSNFTDAVSITFQ